MSDAAILDNRLRPFDAIRAARELFRNPDDTRQVFLVMDALRGRSARRLFERFVTSPTGKVVLAERRRLLDRLQDQAGLARLPAGSLGRAYLAFMQEENLSAAGLVDASDVGVAERLGPDGNLVRDRMRDMHDLTHVLTGYGRDGLGELCLLAFMQRQTGNLGNGLIALMGMGRFPRGKAGKPLRAAVFEGFRNGRKAAWLPGLDWETLLGQDLDAARARLGVIAPRAYQAVSQL